MQRSSQSTSARPDSFSNTMPRSSSFSSSLAQPNVSSTTQLVDSDIVSSLNKFNSTVNKVIDENVPLQKLNPSSYAKWYTSELKKLINEKKEMHAK